jgi:hypothetical protein
MRIEPIKTKPGEENKLKEISFFFGSNRTKILHSLINYYNGMQINADLETEIFS